MKEEFLHFVFKNKLWDKDNLTLTNGKTFEIIDTGIPNNGSGPDFFNSKIKIDDIVFAGNVEIHINSSDWYRHNHHNDFAYENVILHIVYSHDREVPRLSGESIPVWEISFPHYIYNKYAEFKNNNKQIPCEDYFELSDQLIKTLWIERMATEKLELKSELIINYLEKTCGDWENTLYILLAKNFGFHTNSYPFEQLALATDLNIVRKNSDNITTLEALFFGQSGLLSEKTADKYTLRLKEEYSFLTKKYDLKSIPAKIWKTGRIRPNNSPIIRIAQFASLMQSFNGLFSSITENTNISDIKTHFNISVSEYWQKHYDFGKTSDRNLAVFSQSAFEIILINTICPFRLVFYNIYKQSQDKFALEWLSSLKSEKNSIISAWGKIGMIAESALDSQGLIYVKNNYCDLKKCLNCNIGIDIFKKMECV